MYTHYKTARDAAWKTIGNNSHIIMHGLGSREVTTSPPPQPK